MRLTLDSFHSLHFQLLLPLKQKRSRSTGSLTPIHSTPLQIQSRITKYCHAREDESEVK